MLQAKWLRIGLLSGLMVGASGAYAEAAAPVVKKDYDINALVEKADAKRGRILFLQCQACHTLKQGEPNRVGPNLFGVHGRAAAEAKAFAYSDAIKVSAVTWDNDSLDAFLTRPGEFIPGTKMVFVGVKKPEDRAALINWLIQETGK